jgi:hypothetical protein
MEFVHLSVPRRYLPDVVDLLARLTKGQALPKRSRARQWTMDDLRWLRQLLRERLIALWLLDFTSGLDGDSLTFAELCDALGESREKARGELASLTGIVRRYFQRDNWPVTAESEDGVLCYRMRPDVAAMWSAIKSGVEGLPSGGPTVESRVPREDGPG